MSRAAILLLAVLALGACEPAPVGLDAGAAASTTGSGGGAAPVRRLHVGAAAFVADSHFGRMTQAGYLVPDAATIATAPIPLPVGTTLAGVTVFYVVGDGAVRPGVRRMSPATGAITPVWSGAYDASGSEIESQSTALGVVMLDDVHWIEVLLTGPGNRVYGAVLEYIEQDPTGSTL